MKKNVIKDKSYQFSLEIIQLYIQLYMRLREQKEVVLSKQVLRSGTSIGANVEEATAAQSRKDFVAKMAIASKEARETHYWLRLLRESGIVTGIDFSNILNECEQIIKIITAIVKTTKSNS